MSPVAKDNNKAIINKQVWEEISQEIFRSVCDPHYCLYPQEGNDSDIQRREETILV